MLPASAIPEMIGVVLLVVVSAVVNVGAVVSTVRFNALDAAEVFPASSSDVTVRA